MVKLGAGSLHHNIHFDYTENRIGPLEDDRVKGYDRMRWGAYGELFDGLLADEQQPAHQRLCGVGIGKWPKRTPCAPIKL